MVDVFNNTMNTGQDPYAVGRIGAHENALWKLDEGNGNFHYSLDSGRSWSTVDVSGILSVVGVIRNVFHTGSFENDVWWFFGTNGTYVATQSFGETSATGSIPSNVLDILSDQDTIYYQATSGQIFYNYDGGGNTWRQGVNSVSHGTVVPMSKATGGNLVIHWNQYRNNFSYGTQAENEGLNGDIPAAYQVKSVSADSSDATVCAVIDGEGNHRIYGEVAYYDETEEDDVYVKIDVIAPASIEKVWGLYGAVYATLGGDLPGTYIYDRATGTLKRYKDTVEDICKTTFGITYFSGYSASFEVPDGELMLADREEGYPYPTYAVSGPYGGVLLESWDSTKYSATENYSGGGGKPKPGPNPTPSGLRMSEILPIRLCKTQTVTSSDIADNTLAAGYPPGTEGINSKTLKWFIAVEEFHPIDPTLSVVIWKERPYHDISEVYNKSETMSSDAIADLLARTEAGHVVITNFNPDAPDLHSLDLSNYVDGTEFYKQDDRTWWILKDNALIKRFNYMDGTPEDLRNRLDTYSKAEIDAALSATQVAGMASGGGALTGALAYVVMDAAEYSMPSSASYQENEAFEVFVPYLNDSLQGTLKSVQDGVINTEGGDVPLLLLDTYGICLHFVKQGGKWVL